MTKFDYNPERSHTPPTKSDREYLKEIQRLNDVLDTMTSFDSIQTLEEMMDFARVSKSSKNFLN